MNSLKKCAPASTLDLGPTNRKDCNSIEELEGLLWSIGFLWFLPLRNWNKARAKWIMHLQVSLPTAVAVFYCNLLERNWCFFAEKCFCFCCLFLDTFSMQRFDEEEFDIHSSWITDWSRKLCNWSIRPLHLQECWICQLRCYKTRFESTVNLVTHPFGKLW